MANYYALVSGLPNISVEQRKLPMTQNGFAEILEKELTPGDLKLLNILRYENENRRLLVLLEKLDEEKKEESASKSSSDEFLDEADNKPGINESDRKEENAEKFQAFTEIEIKKIVFSVARKKQPEKFKHIPEYIYKYLLERYTPIDEDEKKALEESKDRDSDIIDYKLSKEDRLSALYYEYAMKQSNDFMEDWFKLNLNLKNVLAVYTTKKLGWETKNLIVGDSYVENQMRTSTAKDFGLGDELPYLPQMIAIAEEQDISKRERDLDLFRWRWLEDECFTKVFSIERVLSYYIQLGIIERWVNLNEVTGEKTFRNIVYSLKSESRKSLDEFKKKQQK